jgi:serine beta-lactamase-like protein LACTB
MLKFIPFHTRNDPLGHQPGEKFTYTSHGFTLLSAVIEQVTKQAFVDHMKQNVFEKMGLEDTTTDGNADLMLNRSKYYYRSGCSSSIRASEQERKKVAEEASTNDSSVKEAKIKPKKVPVTNCALQNSPQVDNSMKWAGGGFVSTARYV